MGHRSLAEANRFLVYALSALYALAAIADPLFLSDERVAVRMSFLLGGAALMFVGERWIRSPRLSAALVSIGAVAGGLPLIWTIIVPFAVAVVVASSVALARRDSAAA
ncbi:MAG TPA: hypothetical protein VI540_01255 [Gaiellaceae bacterium]|nr:hypothetical protein [Gaiellaceae bacterium]